MITYKEFPEHNLMEFYVNGKITAEEYDEVIQKFKNRLTEWDNIKVLEIVDDFKGIEALALWNDIKFAFKDFSTINKKLTKCAVVADKKWIEYVTKAFEPFVKSEIEFFPPKEGEKARDWLLQ